MQSHGVVWFDEPQPGTGRLSRNRIVEAAIELADADVRGEVTMRAVAARLGSSTPMSLYRYVGSKDGLTDLMLDRVTAEFVVPTEGTWQERLHGLALSARAAVRRHPWFARLTFSRPPFGPQSLAMFDAALAALEPLDLDAATRMGFVSTVLGHVYATGLAELEEAAMRHRIGVTDEAQLAEAAEPYHRRIAEQGNFPHYIRWSQDPQRMQPPPFGFEETLDWLIAGLGSVAAR